MVAGVRASLTLAPVFYCRKPHRELLKVGPWGVCFDPDPLLLYLFIRSTVLFAVLSSCA